MLRTLISHEVDERENRHVLDHVAGCPSCTEILAQLIASLSSLDLKHSINSGEETLQIAGRLCNLPAPVEDFSLAGLEHCGSLEIPGLTELELVGRGGMGVVFTAIDTRLDRRVAVKLLYRFSGIASEPKRTQTWREATLLARINHPNVVQIFGSGEVNGIPYLIMEWVPGGTLQYQITLGAIAPRDAMRIVRDLALALVEAHTLGIIHRDLKPDNVLLLPGRFPGDGFIPKLADFGLARPLKAPEGMSGTGIIEGTPSYMAPEQTGLDHNLGEVGPVTDIHGLGAILYSALTGEAPFKGKGSRESILLSVQGASPVGLLAPHLPADLKSIVDKCLERVPSRRYQSATALADDLDRLLEGRPILARTSSPVERVHKWCVRHPIAVLAAGSLCVVLFLFSCGLGYQAYRTGVVTQKYMSSQAHAQTSLAALTDESVERLLKRGPALNEVDRAFLTTIRDRYVKWPMESDLRSSLTFRAKGLRRVGLLFEQIEQFEEALSCHQAALESMEELARRGMADSEMIQARLDQLIALCHVQYRLGRKAESEALVRLQIQELRKVVEPVPQVRKHLGRGLILLGLYVAEQGRYEEADEYVNEALLCFANLHNDFPDDVGIRHDELTCLYNAAFCSSLGGRDAERKSRLEAMVELGEAALRDFPEQRELLAHPLLVGMTTLADIPLERNEPEEALPIVERRRELALNLTERFPENLKLRSEAIAASVQHFRMNKQLGRQSDVRHELSRAVTWAMQASEAEPAVFDRVMVLSQIMLTYAEYLTSVGEEQQAISEYDRLIAALTPWLKKEHERINQDLMCAIYQSAQLSSEIGNHSGSAQRLERLLGFTSLEKRADILLILANEYLQTQDMVSALGAIEMARLEMIEQSGAQALLARKGQ